MVLLRSPLRLASGLVERALGLFPKTAAACLGVVSDDGSRCRLKIGGREYSVASLDFPIPKSDFHKMLAKPGSCTIEALVDDHSAHLIVTCLEGRSTMEEAVEVASTIHLLAARLGALGDAVGGFWISSEQLRDWGAFTRDANTAASAVSGSGTPEFPTRYWVSVQLTQDGEAFGGATQGLRSFTGYEVELAPVSWPMSDVADHLVGTVLYLFEAGPVLKDGETLGVSQEKRFRISIKQDELKLRLGLEDETAIRGSNQEEKA
ncbi:MAG: DUF4261 domain-containing protein [Pseudomonadota bacterium]